MDKLPKLILIRILDWLFTSFVQSWRRKLILIIFPISLPIFIVFIVIWRFYLITGFYNLYSVFDNIIMLIYLFKWLIWAALIVSFVFNRWIVYSLWLWIRNQQYSIKILVVFLVSFVRYHLKIKYMIFLIFFTRFFRFYHSHSLKVFTMSNISIA